MFSFEQKRDEAKRAVAELRRRMTNRVHRKRVNNDRAALRVEIAEAIVADYERAIARRESLASDREPSEATQYLLALGSRPAGSLWPVGAEKDDGSD